MKHKCQYFFENFLKNFLDKYNIIGYNRFSIIILKELTALAFDAAAVKCFVFEAQNKLINGKIDKVYQPQKDEICFSIRTIGSHLKLYVSANPNYPRIFFSNEKNENPSVAPMFCMLLRKHLTSGRITAISQYDFERIIKIEIESFDELLELTKKNIYIELMGKFSNIILTDKDNKIIDSIKRIDISTSSIRQILPGLTYKFPPAQDKINPLSNQLTINLIESMDLSESEIMSKFYGISKIIAREIIHLANNKDKLSAFTDVFSRISENKFSPCVIYNDETPVDFSVIPITQYGPGTIIKECSSVSEAIETFYREKSLKFRIQQNIQSILKTVNNNIERCRKKLKIFNQQLLDSAKREQYKQYGELITANIYKISPGDTEVEVCNYFEEGMPSITIKLDPNIPPSKLAQHYYTKYNKAKTAETQAHIQIESATRELEYLESVSEALMRVRETSDIKEIRDELIQEGYIKDIDTSSKRKKKNDIPQLKKEIIEGYTVYIGRNNKQNDYLTLKIAHSTDIWLHTKNIPGSHIIVIKKPNEEIPESVIIAAAKLAAINSKAKGLAKTPVDYTSVKNVKKPSGAKPGMVIYDNYNTVYVN